MCEFHDSNGNGLGDMWWTDTYIYFSIIARLYLLQKCNDFEVRMCVIIYPVYPLCVFLRNEPIFVSTALIDIAQPVAKLLYLFGILGENEYFANVVDQQIA